MKSQKNKGFTLLECLVALLMLAGILLVISGLIKYTEKTERQLSYYQEREWHVFLFQLEHELRQATYREVKNNQIIFEDQLVIKQLNDKLIKSKGYQPLLTNVKQFTCYETKGGVEYEVEFSQGTKKSGAWIIK
ncbi:competence type IV pilus minor pilin ComGF [Enterococcus sp. CSURQ0835]|uniref:competence type IV pilus minor pilin ComGF n=1 Tax=Enterococcus sp. CSURQ0835 TaxID=2681394 RepID=UPI001F25242D|nr:competence type IV pilus minor pilin ComGF [Enterococcus sp. CSURQ0835]